MLIGGLQKFSLLDYPGYLSAIIFTQGCNFQCQFCYNPMLALPNTKDHALIKEDDLLCFLKQRINKLDSVVITGGEPTIHNDLPEFIQKIKQLNYLIKLDTNGTNPKTLAYLIKNKLINYIAMDVKICLKKYNKITGKKVNLNNIKKSIKIIIQSDLPYEFRTTIVPELFEAQDIHEIGRLIYGAKKWFLQNFKSDVELINNTLKNKKNFSDIEMQYIKEIAKQYVDICEIR